MFIKQIVSSSRGDFEIFVGGNGPALVCTHLYSEFNENANIFSRQLAQHYTVHLMNLRGCGNSCNITEDFTYSMYDAVEDMEAVRESLSIEHWIYAGHSTGGMLGLVYAVEQPDELDYLIVGGLSAWNGYMNHPGSIYCHENPNYERINEIFTRVNERDCEREERTALFKEWTMMSIHNDCIYEDLMKRKESGKTHLQRLDYFSEVELPDFDLRHQLNQIDLPVYIYSGLYDAQCPSIFSEEAAELIPGAVLYIFENSNHIPYIEEEEAFVSMVEQIYLKEHNQ